MRLTDSRQGCNTSTSFVRFFQYFEGITVTDVLIRRILHVQAGGTSLLLQVPDQTAPFIAYSGPALGDPDDAELDAIIQANLPQQRVGDDRSADPRQPHSGQRGGWTGAPGIEGHRGRRAFSPAFVCLDHSVDSSERGARITLHCADVESALEMTISIEVLPSGLVRQRLLRNTGPGEYEVQALRAVFPIPNHVDELLDLTGRWMRERVPQRHALTVGRYAREGRKGRPGADASLLLIAGEHGFGFQHGAVRAVHVAWSGNHELAADRTILGGTVLTGAELSLPGELALAPGGEVQSPWVYAAHAARVSTSSPRGSTPSCATAMGILTLPVA